MNTLSIAPHSTRYVKGATLIEALIAALLVGVGLLGIASLQLQALRGSSDAHFRSTATDIAWMVSDRIRANIPSIEDYDGKTTWSDCSTTPAKVCAMAPNDSTAVSICSPAQMITHDLYEASCLSGIDTLPGGTITITKAASPNPAFISRFNIAITWNTRNKDSDDNFIVEQLTMSVIPGSDPAL